MLDVYRVLERFSVRSHAVGHAIKKLLVAGGRGAGKDYEKDLREAVDSIHRELQMIAEDCNAGTLEPRPEPKTVTATLEVKVDPAAGLLAEAVKVLQAIEGSPISEQTVRIHARALLRKIENADYKPMVLDRNMAAETQGVDLVRASTEQLSIERSRMPIFSQHDAVGERETDSFSHNMQAEALVKGIHHGG